ncbi:Hypothetical predicted protein [Mytilus galloprovincialis]|uniref:Uncharacterized protein n=1 Tax=Mytilus galloprovincialis TaxID=29158 RepID=A0A8B6EJN5_MYTGA|nr:Hypothetical predicted protein [Mytilus galloprovincialis]
MSSNRSSANTSMVGHLNSYRGHMEPMSSNRSSANTSMLQVIWEPMSSNRSSANTSMGSHLNSYRAYGNQCLVIDHQLIHQWLVILTVTGSYGEPMSIIDHQLIHQWSQGSYGEPMSSNRSSANTSMGRSS